MAGVRTTTHPGVNASYSDDMDVQIIAHSDLDFRHSTLPELTLSPI